MKSSIDKFLMDQAKDTAAACQETCEQAQAREDAVTANTEIKTGMTIKFREADFQVSNTYSAPMIWFEPISQTQMINNWFPEARTYTVKEEIDSRIACFKNEILDLQDSIAHLEKLKSILEEKADLPWELFAPLRA
jgi:hypothetical protein